MGFAALTSRTVDDDRSQQAASLEPMGMGSPETAREADDSYRLFAAVGVCPETAARRVFVFAEHDMMTYLWIAIGSALGGMARHWCTLVAAKWLGTAFPWGTLAINILGSFVIGLFFTLTGVDGRFDAPADAKAFVMVGICGGYTTFSSSSACRSLWRSLQEGPVGARRPAYIVASVVAVPCSACGPAMRSRARSMRRGRGREGRLMLLRHCPRTRAIQSSQSLDETSAGALLICCGLLDRPLSRTMTAQ